jgi:beta-lactamase superfamily II metal-dependent hydrolase
VSLFFTGCAVKNNYGNTPGGVVTEESAQTTQAYEPKTTQAEPPLPPSLPYYTEPGTMQVYLFGIGRADSIVITTQSHAVMIDTGESEHGNIIADYLFNRGITEIDYLIITHLDRDHVGGAYIVINNVRVKNIIAPNYSRDSAHVARFLAAASASGINPVMLNENLHFTLDDVDFTVNPSQLEYMHFSRHDDDDNHDDESTQPTGDDFSLAVSVSHGDNSLLFTGDALAGRLSELLNNNEIMSKSYDFLKVPKHGRHNSTSVSFIQAIRPKYAVITGFCPSLSQEYYPERPADARVIAALENVGAEVVFTMSGGARFKSDGVEIIKSE